MKSHRGRGDHEEVLKVTTIKKGIGMGWIVIIGTLLASLLGYLWGKKHKDD